MASYVACSVDYFHNYTMHRPVNGQAQPSGTDHHARLHTYYAAIPEFIQVAEHVYVERQVVELFITSMELSWYELLNILCESPTLLINCNKDVSHELCTVVQHVLWKGQEHPPRLSRFICHDYCACLGCVRSTRIA